MLKAYKNSELCARILKSLAKAMVRFDGVHTFSYNSARSEAIWNWGTLSILFAAGPGMGHIAVTCQITLNHLSTVAMRLMSNYFHHLLSLDAHIDSRTDSPALRADYCIMGTP